MTVPPPLPQTETAKPSILARALSKCVVVIKDLNQRYMAFRDKRRAQALQRKAAQTQADFAEARQLMLAFPQAYNKIFEAKASQQPALIGHAASLGKYH